MCGTCTIDLCAAGVLRESQRTGSEYRDVACRVVLRYGRVRRSTVVLLSCEYSTVERRTHPHVLTLQL